MSESLSLNTRSILLLTAPLIAGRGKRSSDLLTPSDCKELARHWRARGSAAAAVARALGVTEPQVQKWLKRLVAEKVLVKDKRRARYAVREFHPADPDGAEPGP